MRLELAIARRELVIDELRARITAEEALQRAVQRQIDDRIGVLRNDVDRISAEIPRLEHRLERLGFARRALSDIELDDEEQVERAEEAAFWAEWRQQREQKRGAVINYRPTGNQDVTLRQLYLALARLIHPDLARDSGDRSRREAVMRLANEANDAADVEQLRRLLAIWSKPQDSGAVRDVSVLMARLSEKEIELGELSRQLVALEEGFLGRMARSPRIDLTRHIKRNEEQLRREVATLRLRRRRLLSSLEDRRRRLAEASD
ncbi:MAG TPA: hypothetical protein VMM78_16580 [Thermomicrobiales bacterium]|nr:hypothetical protein [Thermomicrobiales bacterium]